MKRETALGITCLAIAAIMAMIFFLKPNEVERKIATKPSEPVRSAQLSKPTEPSPKLIRMKVTAYCLCLICCKKWSGYAKTSIGDDARIYDGVAADPELLPYRTKLNIPGIGIKEVDDTGGAMRQDAKEDIYHIDVRMPSHSEARKFEVKWLNVEVMS